MIQFRRLTALLIGAWLAGSVFMDVAAIQNFQSVDRFLAEPGTRAAELIRDAGRDHTRTLLRRAAAEANGWLFEQWEWIQLVGGLSLVLVMVFGNRPPKTCIGLAMLMIGLVLVERFAFTPRIIGLGRVIEFFPANPKLPERVNFGFYHTAYTLLDLVKLLAGAVIACILVVRRRPDPQMFAKEAEIAAQSVPRRRAVR